MSKNDHGSGAYASGAPKGFMLGDFVLSSKPMSAKALAAAQKAKAEAHAAKKAESDRSYKEYMEKHKSSVEVHQPPKPPRSVTCALCKKVRSVGDAIAIGWKKHDFFANQAVCDACDTAHPLTVPKLVWTNPTYVSVPHAKMLNARTADGMRKHLSAAFLTPPVYHKPVGHAEVTPFMKAQHAELTKSIHSRKFGHKRGGTRRTKSRSRSKSRF